MFETKQATKQMLYAVNYLHAPWKATFMQNMCMDDLMGTMKNIFKLFLPFIVTGWIN